MTKLHLTELPTDNLPEAKRRKQRIYAIYQHHKDKPSDLLAVFYGGKGKKLADFLMCSWAEEL